MAMRQENMLGPQSVDDYACIKEQIELRDDKGGMPCRSRFARENILLVFTRKSPFEDFRMRGLGEGGCKARVCHVGDEQVDSSWT